MIETVAQHHRQYRKDDLTVARGAELLELPTTTFHLLVVLLTLGTVFVVAHYPRRAQLLIGCDQNDMVRPFFLLIPEANHTGVQGHVTLGPHMFDAPHPGNVLLGPGGMHSPRVLHLGELNSLLRREHFGFERHADIDLP